MYSALELNNKSFEDFYVKFCGMQACTPKYSYGPAIRHHHLLHICLAGKGQYHVDNKVYTIKAGDVFLIEPEVVTYYQADEEDPWTYAWIGFSGTKTDVYLHRSGFTPQQLVVHCEYVDEVRELFISMLAHNKLSYSNEFFIQGQLFIFFSYLAKSAKVKYQEKENKDYNPYVNKAIEYVQNNYQNVVTVAGIAEYLSINRSYLTVLFNKHLHMSPQEFLFRYRMHQAEELLINSDLNMSQIAFSCGYANSLSFSKAFHQSHDMSPRDYRKQHALKEIHTRVQDPHAIKK